MGRFARQYSSTYEQLAADIYKFCEAFNFDPTWQQRQLFDAVMRAEYGNGPLQIACKSGQGPGKTTASVLVGLWRAYRWPMARVILTAPTMRQLTDGWIAEARRLVEEADPVMQRIIEVKTTRIVIGKKRDWGIQTVTATKAENAQGKHHPNMTIILDEASGIDRALVEQFKGTASNPNCLFLMMGNPNTRDCAFFDCFNSLRHLWFCITWNAEQTPASKWFDPNRNSRLEEEFGRDSDVYRIRVMGDFPHADPNCVMSSEDIEKCTAKELMLRCVTAVRAYSQEHIKQFGLDFARFGGDENVIMKRSGNAIVQWEKYAHTDPARVVERTFRMQADSFWRDRQTWFVADAGGIGQGVMHKFHDAHKNIIEFHNNGVATETRKYANKITEGWWNLARLVRSQECYLPNDNVLIKQLAGRQYFTNKKGLLVLESKDEYMKRGNDSPDRADACVLAFWDKVVVGGNVATRSPGSHRVGASIGVSR